MCQSFNTFHGITGNTAKHLCFIGKFWLDYGFFGQIFLLLCWDRFCLGWSKLYFIFRVSYFIYNYCYCVIVTINSKKTHASFILSFEYLECYTPQHIVQTGMKIYSIRKSCIPNNFLLRVLLHRPYCTSKHDLGPYITIHVHLMQQSANCCEEIENFHTQT